MRTTAAIEPDPLSELLGELRFRSGVFARVEVAAPWGIEVPDLGKAMFHFVVEGRCTLDIEGVRSPLQLGAGDLVIFPHGDVHAMRDPAGTPSQRIDHLLARHPLGEDRVLRLANGRKPTTTLICGGYWFEDRQALSVLRSLPPVLSLSGEAPGFEWVRVSLDRIGRELTTGSAGGSAIAARLADAVFIEAARSYFAGAHGEGRTPSSALRDPAIGLALTLLHRDPQRAWTVERIAAEVGLSRAAFAARFVAVLGEPPMKHLARHRISRAMRHLRSSDAAIAEIAQRVGYASEAAFSRAFVKYTGTTPAAHRRRGEVQSAPDAEPATEAAAAVATDPEQSGRSELLDPRPRAASRRFA
jgi:AraC-like DNA-binding protein